MDVQVMPIPQYERYIGQLSNVVPSVHDCANRQSANERASFRYGRTGSALIDTSSQEWGIPLLNRRAERVREQQAKDALSFPEIYGEGA
jgi:hypothetical protein